MLTIGLIKLVMAALGVLLLLYLLQRAFGIEAMQYLFTKHVRGEEAAAELLQNRPRQQ